MTAKRYIHYGHNDFSKEAFAPIKNRRVSNKPYGGLWASPVDAPFGWKNWCKDAGFRECSEENSFEFSIAPEAKILVIDSSAKAKRLPQRPLSVDELGIRGLLPVTPDFERLAEVCDAIEFRLSDDRSLYHTMYCWDCDSILIMNPDIIRAV